MWFINEAEVMAVSCLILIASDIWCYKGRD